MALFRGLDWASHTHAACVIDERGAIRVQVEITHDKAGWPSWAECSRPSRVGPWPSRSFGTDRRCAVDAGFTVVPIHPNVVRRPARAIAAMVARATALTRTCWPTVAHRPLDSRPWLLK